jgi:3-oxoacyl-(acyl-carrier-protein) synthase
MPSAVITGASLICPAGLSAEAVFDACLAKRCAGDDCGLPAPLERIPLAILPEIPELAESAFAERSAALAVLAARDALADAGIDDAWMRRETSAIVAGTSKAGVLTALAANESVYRNVGRNRRSTEKLGRLWQGGLPSCALEALVQTYRPGGEVRSVVAACATGLVALSQGAALIASGLADTVLVVAADATIHPLFVASFARMGVLAKWSSTPADACRPFSADRTGFVLSEGSAAMVLQADSATRTDGRPAVRVCGWCLGNQAGHLVQPNDSGDALAHFIATAIRRSGWTTDSVGLVHAHGTATLAGDLAETRAIRTAFGRAPGRFPVLASKPITGHMLGAAGLAQAVITRCALQAGVVPPTANLNHPDPACDLDCNPQGPRPMSAGRALCLASGFGGSSAALAMEMQ